MKKFFAVLLFALATASAVVAEEINYYNKTWAEIKAKAKAEHKYIFMDCYTDWCGWCKVMDKETMIDPAIVATMNGKFVAVKMDMEKGEGATLAMKYHINMFPTFMFFNPDGEFVYQSLGYQKTDEFKKELANAMDKSKQTIATGYSQSLDIDYPAFYKKMFAGNGKREIPKEEEVVAYLDKQTDLLSEVNWAVMSQCRLNDKYEQFFLANVDKYRKLFGPKGVSNTVNYLLNGKLKKAEKEKSEKALADVLKLVDKYVDEEKEMTRIGFEISYYQEVKDFSKLTKVFQNYVDKKGFENAAYINSIAWWMYVNCTDKAQLASGAKWMKEVVKKEPKYAYEDTYAAVLYKAGKMKDAEIWAKKAIEDGNKEGEKVSSTEDLLKLIQGGAPAKDKSAK